MRQFIKNLVWLWKNSIQALDTESMRHGTRLANHRKRIEKLETENATEPRDRNPAPYNGGLVEDD